MEKLKILQIIFINIYLFDFKKFKEKNLKKAIKAKSFN